MPRDRLRPQWNGPTPLCALWQPMREERSKWMGRHLTSCGGGRDRQTPGAALCPGLISERGNYR
eukprot:573560-Alexandrium_andersonii.AAC.1